MTADEGQDSPQRADAEARYWQLLELSPEAIAIHRDGRLVYVNPAGIQLIGAASMDQLVGRSILEFVHPEDRPRVIARARQVQVEGRLAELATERFLRLDGEVIDVQVISIPTIHEGQPAAQVVIRDVTAQVRAEAALRRAEERMRLLVQASEQLFSPLDLDQVLAEVLDLAQRQIAADAYAVWQRSDETGKWTTVASAGLSKSYRDEAGRTLARATPMSDQPVAIEDIEREPRLASHLAQHRAEGTRALLVAPLRFRGEVSGTIAFYYHQPHQFAEDEIREATALANLAAAAIGITSLYQDQLQLRAEAEAAVRVRDDFLGLASHDLRHPLAAIAGSAQMVQRYLARSGTAPPDQVSRALSRVEESANQMRAALDEIVDVARLQTGRPLDLQRQPIDLLAIARQAVADQQAAAPRHRLRLDATMEKLVGSWDARRLERVLANLLSNAVKYSPNGGTVSVSLREEASAPDWVELQVSDQGLGIPAEDQSHIFERFYRGRNVRGYTPGTGLGLAGVRQIVEQHGGTITFESAEGRGTTFTIRLPREHAAG